MEALKSTDTVAPTFTAEDTAILKQYFEFNEKYYWKVNEELTATLATHPLWGPILSMQTAEQRRVQNEQSLEMQRAAIYDGKWDAYTQNLMMQGVMYARMNVSYTDWYEILKLYKDSLIPHIRKDFANSAEKAITFLEGLSKFIDYAMQVIAQAYFQEKNDIIRANEERFRAIFENSADHIFLFNKKGIITMINRVTQGTKEEVVGTSLIDRQTKTSAEVVRGAIRTVFENGTPASYLTDHLIQGERRFFASSIRPIFDKDGGITSAVAIARDVTPEKIAEEKIRELNTDLEKKVHDRTEELRSSIKELEAFSYSISHDLRGPLRAIIGFTQILNEDHSGKMDDDARDAMNEIVTNARRMGQLIDDLLEFSRLGKQEIKKTRIDMTELVGGVIKELNAPIKDRNVTYQVKLLPKSCGDRAMIKQVLTNIISNALKYSGKKEQPVIEVGSYPEGDQTVYYIKDNGAGFDMAYYSKLFGVFQRLHRSKEFEGTGVGLAIVYRIVTKHNGKIWAESKVGEGATFFISLPPE